MAITAIAISFFVIILSVSISAGFREQIRSSVSDITGDIVLSDGYTINYSDSDPICTEPSYLGKIQELEGVEEIHPVVYRTGILKLGEQIRGAIFKGTDSDTVSFGIRVPRKLGLSKGESLLVYFISEKVKLRKFTVTGLYDSPVENGDDDIIYANISDLRRLNLWSASEASALEVKTSTRTPRDLESLAEEMSIVASTSAGPDETPLVANSCTKLYPQLFDWLSLIDYNVYAILLLMILVAGFNMISGLLIMLFHHISTIGTLKALGMTNRSIAEVFLRVSARIVLWGIAIGNALALLFCLLQGTTHLIKLNAQNYFVSFVPVSVDLWGIVLADAIGFVAIMLLLLLPSLFISSLDPSSTVRTE